ncbi:hypothetical protein B0T22DRAFT_437053 [Podospora appendiculata]|uniref:Cyanovirin-N domain-containing protein n=1 Tax=Podospora appendiculata TaxID=314037 RepID=A0AAE1CGW4_9PEZI|nr:hypothetical protein B0T22DRAFT_437053 [Podospora appendiculata]
MNPTITAILVALLGILVTADPNSLANCEICGLGRDNFGEEPSRLQTICKANGPAGLVGAGPQGLPEQQQQQQQRDNGAPASIRTLEQQRETGSFQKTCFFCDFSRSTVADATLACSCVRDDKSKYNEAVISLATFLANDNGYLTCSDGLVRGVDHACGT